MWGEDWGTMHWSTITAALVPITKWAIFVLGFLTCVIVAKTIATSKRSTKQP